MGKIKKDIEQRVKAAGSKEKARREAEDWFNRSKQSLFNKEVVTTTTRFTPGKIYVFKYFDPKYKQDLPWFDENPVVLAVQADVEHDFGINLNLLPVYAKETMLDRLYDQLIYRIQAQTTGFKAADAGLQTGLGVSYQGVERMLKYYGFDFALRQYIIKRRSKQAVIAYENWADIALCDFVSINGDSINNIKRMYSNNK